MAASVYYGDNSSSAALMYEPISRDLNDWILETNHRVLSSLSSRARSFFDRSARYRERIGFDRAVSMREQVSRGFNKLYVDNNFRYLGELLDFQLAKPRMRRYLLAEPELRRLYRDKRLSGWENEVSDDPSIPVDEIPEYLHTIQGVLIDDKDTTVYNELLDLYQEKEPMSLSETVDVMLSWERMKAIIKYDRLDPSSPYGASMD